MRAGRRTIPTAPRGCQSNRDGWRFKTSTRGVSKRVGPLRGDRTRGLAPFVGAGEAGLRAEPATVDLLDMRGYNYVNVRPEGPRMSGMTDQGRAPWGTNCMWAAYRIR